MWKGAPIAFWWSPESRVMEDEEEKMVTLFNSASLWIGRDMNRFHDIRNALSDKNIPYKYKVKNRLGQWGGRGTVRGRTGSFGNQSEQMYEYEIFVYRKDLEQAQYLIRN